jgi:hypothetical protein
MKKLLLIGLILGLFTSLSYAQMGGQKGETGKGMMGGQQGQMMSQGQMTNNMMGMTSKMSDMLGKLSGMMKDMPATNMKQMADIMRGMSQQMMDMSKTMGIGAASEKDMKHLQDGMMQMQKKVSELETKK